MLTPLRLRGDDVRFYATNSPPPPSAPPRADTPAAYLGLAEPASTVPAPLAGGLAPPAPAGAGAFLLAVSPFAAGLLTGWLVGMGGSLIGVLLTLGRPLP